jgi:hypothetical protein
MATKFRWRQQANFAYPRANLPTGQPAAGTDVPATARPISPIPVAPVLDGTPTPDERIAILLARIAELQEEIRIFRENDAQTLRSQQTQNEVTTRTITGLRLDLERAQARVAELEARTPQDVLQVNATQRDEIERLTRDNALLQTRYDTLHRDSQQVLQPARDDADLLAANREIMQLTEELQTYARNNTALQTEINKLQVDIATQRGRAQMWETQLPAMTNQLQQARETIRDQQLRITELERNAHPAEAPNDDQQARITELEQRLENMQNTLNDATEERHMLEGRMHEQDEEIRVHEIHVRDLGHELEAANQALEEAHAKIQGLTDAKNMLDEMMRNHQVQAAGFADERMEIAAAIWPHGRSDGTVTTRELIRGINMLKERANRGASADTTNERRYGKALSKIADTLKIPTSKRSAESIVDAVEKVVDTATRTTDILARYFELDRTDDIPEIARQAAVKWHELNLELNEQKRGANRRNPAASRQGMPPISRPMMSKPAFVASDSNNDGAYDNEFKEPTVMEPVNGVFRPPAAQPVGEDTARRLQAEKNDKFKAPTWHQKFSPMQYEEKICAPLRESVFDSHDRCMLCRGTVLTPDGKLKHRNGSSTTHNEAWKSRIVSVEGVKYDWPCPFHECTASFDTYGGFKSHINQKHKLEWLA